METPDIINFRRIKLAIEYIDKNFKSQPDLQQIADHINLSPYHFQRLFTEWAGVSPKQFLQYASIEHAKQLLRDTRATLFDTAYETGLSGTGRLHDLFLKIERMTPGEYKNGGKDLIINYTTTNSHFGKILLASTSKGICHIEFINNETASLETLRSKFPNAVYTENTNMFLLRALDYFNHIGQEPQQPILLHLKGSEFQLKVWEALLKIPFGNLSTYNDIAQIINNPQACRAVGNAIGKNPIAFLIPCHRVIQSSGAFGGYMWGKSRKAAIIGWESSVINQQNNP